MGMITTRHSKSGAQRPRRTATFNRLDNYLSPSPTHWSLIKFNHEFLLKNIRDTLNSSWEIEQEVQENCR